MCFFHFSSNIPYEIDDILHKLNNYPCQSRRRLKTVLWGLHSISYKRFPSFRCHKVNCLKMLFQFITEPYISSAEICGVVKYFVGNGADEFVDKVRQIFEAFYPESINPYQPRSLKYLSRCCILQKLRREGRFPQGVDQLSLSDELRDYIFPKKCPFIPSSTLSEKEIFSEKSNIEDECDSKLEFYIINGIFYSKNFVNTEGTICLERLKLNIQTRKFSILKLRNA